MDLPRETHIQNIDVIIHQLYLLADGRVPNEVAAGNFEVEIENVESGDEIGIVSRAFQKMVTTAP